MPIDSRTSWRGRGTPARRRSTGCRRVATAGRDPWPRARSAARRTEAHQPDEAPVRRDAHPADILDRSEPHQRDRGDIGPEREQQAGQRQKAERVQKRVEPRHVGQGGAAAGRHRPQVEQQGMAGVVGDGALGDRHQLAVLADGEPGTAFERALRAIEPTPAGGQPARRHDVRQIAAASGVLERPTRIAPAQAEPRTRERPTASRLPRLGHLPSHICYTSAMWGRAPDMARQPADGNDAWRAASPAAGHPRPPAGAQLQPLPCCGSMRSPCCGPILPPPWCAVRPSRPG